MNYISENVPNIPNMYPAQNQMQNQMQNQIQIQNQNIMGTLQYISGLLQQRSQDNGNTKPSVNREVIGMFRQIMNTMQMQPQTRNNNQQDSPVGLLRDVLQGINNNNQGGFQGGYQSGFQSGVQSSSRNFPQQQYVQMPPVNYVQPQTSDYVPGGRIQGGRRRSGDRRRDTERRNDIRIPNDYYDGVYHIDPPIDDVQPDNDRDGNINITKEQSRLMKKLERLITNNKPDKKAITYIINDLLKGN